MCCWVHEDKGEGEGKGGWQHTMTRVMTRMLLSLLLCCWMCEEEGQDKEVLLDAWEWGWGWGRAMVCDGKGYDNDDDVVVVVIMLLDTWGWGSGWEAVVRCMRTRIKARACCWPHKDEGKGEGGQWFTRMKVTTTTTTTTLLCKGDNVVVVVVLLCSWACKDKRAMALVGFGWWKVVWMSKWAIAMTYHTRKYPAEGMDKGMGTDQPYPYLYPVNIHTWDPGGSALPMLLPSHGDWLILSYLCYSISSSFPFFSFLLGTSLLLYSMISWQYCRYSWIAAWSK